MERQNTNQQPSLKKVSKYTIDLNDVLGQGSFGMVCKGYIDLTQQIVAVKIMQKATIANNPYMVKALQYEISIMKKLRSPKVVHLLDFIETQNYFYLFLEYCPEGDLRKILNQRKRLPEKEALHYLKDILKAFIDLLQNGIIHRDMKPENILTKNGCSKIADFGLSRTVENYSKQMMQSMVGTPLYMPPQILKNKKYTTKCDIWSIGIIYYELLYGCVPYIAQSPIGLIEKIKSSKIQFPSDIEVSKNSQEFIKKCLKYSESDRISWDKLFKHPLFENYFDKLKKNLDLLENKSRFVLNNLRNTIFYNYINLEGMFQKFNINVNTRMNYGQFKGIINFQQKILMFKEFMLKIDSELSDLEIEYLMYKFDADGDKTVDFQEFSSLIIDDEVQLQVNNFNQLLKIQDDKNDERAGQIITAIQQKLPQVDQNFSKAMEITFGLTQTSKLQKQTFSDFLLQIVPKFNKEDVDELFKLLDENNKKKILFSQFTEWIQKYNFKAFCNSQQQNIAFQQNQNNQIQYVQPIQQQNQKPLLRMSDQQHQQNQQNFQYNQQQQYCPQQAQQQQKQHILQPPQQYQKQPPQQCQYQHQQPQQQQFQQKLKQYQPQQMMQQQVIFQLSLIFQQQLQPQQQQQGQNRGIGVMNNQQVPLKQLPMTYPPQYQKR